LFLVPFSAVCVRFILTVRRTLVAWLRKVCPEFFRSTLALVLYGVIFGSSMCAARRARGVDDQPNVLVSGFLAAFAFLLEPQERRIELVKFLFKDVWLLDCFLLFCASVFI
jgi:hypothetical protein